MVHDCGTRDVRVVVRGAEMLESVSAWWLIGESLDRLVGGARDAGVSEDVVRGVLNRGLGMIELLLKEQMGVVALTVRRAEEGQREQAKDGG